MAYTGPRQLLKQTFIVINTEQVDLTQIPYKGIHHGLYRTWISNIICHPIVCVQ